METGDTSGKWRQGHESLKPSLVEWKQVARLHGRSNRGPLKPSLVEWKLVQLPPNLEGKGSSLKPSLVEWKHSGSARAGDPARVP